MRNRCNGAFNSKTILREPETLELNSGREVLKFPTPSITTTIVTIIIVTTIIFIAREVYTTDYGYISDVN
jgi:hypothetical protein